jgi:hypothetical protein
MKQIVQYDIGIIISNGESYFLLIQIIGNNLTRWWTKLVSLIQIKGKYAIVRAEMLFTVSLTKKNLIKYYQNLFLYILKFI